MRSLKTEHYFQSFFYSVFSNPCQILTLFPMLELGIYWRRKYWSIPPWKPGCHSNWTDRWVMFTTRKALGGSANNLEHDFSTDAFQCRHNNNKCSAIKTLCGLRHVVFTSILHFFWLRESSLKNSKVVFSTGNRNKLVIHDNLESKWSC